MPHADHHAVLAAVPGQGEVLIVLRSQGDVLDHALRRLLVALELLHRGPCDGFRRLGALVLHVQIGTFKMDSQHLGSLVALSGHSGHIRHGLLQHIRHLRHSGGKDGGHALLGDAAHPLPQSLRFPVVGVKIVGSVGVDIDKARHNPVIPAILVRLSAVVREHPQNLPFLNFQLGRNKLPCNPDPFTLNDHSMSSPLSYIYYYRIVAVSKCRGLPLCLSIAFPHFFSTLPGYFSVFAPK